MAAWEGNRGPRPMRLPLRGQRKRGARACVLAGTRAAASLQWRQPRRCAARHSPSRSSRQCAEPVRRNVPPPTAPRRGSCCPSKEGKADNFVNESRKSNVKRRKARGGWNLAATHLPGYFHLAVVVSSCHLQFVVVEREKVPFFLSCSACSTVDNNFTRKLHLEKTFIPELLCANTVEEKRKAAFPDRMVKGSTSLMSSRKRKTLGLTKRFT
ncbi:hypothetical protein PVAP13_7NG113000 [Panicum virgatum]|uniref:Uncharacterized protein n=1 Tax=Panicum virgatum TaxID=38727 RepID=A0A8T0PUV4_PANVG|nr:hypothetical protein PVAP13_7NG113000 [Panicum virgatum]